MSSKDIRIGMIGIGMMGHGIATNIVKHGYPLAFLDHPGNQPVDALLAAGARSVASIGESPQSQTSSSSASPVRPRSRPFSWGLAACSSRCGRGRS